MREFNTAVQEVLDEDNEIEGLTFMVDGRECTCFPPSDGQLAFLMASVGRHTSLHQRVSGVINFFVEVLDEESHQYLVGRLLDRTDDFGIDEVTEIMDWMVEEWTGRPTQQPSGSTRSPRTGGQKSTPRTRPSTS